jgi:DNA-binding NarL/FixJ family response regulator
MKKQNEIWKAVKQNENYEVSTNGRVRHTYKNGKVKILTPLTNGQQAGDYLFIVIDGRKYYMHHLVLETFIGAKPSGHECDHINSNKTDNSLSNLQYLTRAENRSHKGSSHGMSKLTEKLVKAIKKLVEMGISQKQIADLYEVSASTISGIIAGKTWQHVV